MQKLEKLLDKVMLRCFNPILTPSVAFNFAFVCALYAVNIRTLPVCHDEEQIATEKILCSLAF